MKLTPLLMGRFKLGVRPFYKGIGHYPLKTRCCPSEMVYSELNTKHSHEGMRCCLLEILEMRCLLLKVRQGTTVRMLRDGVSGFADTHENNAGSFTSE